VYRVPAHCAGIKYLIPELISSSFNTSLVNIKTNHLQSQQSSLYVAPTTISLCVVMCMWGAIWIDSQVVMAPVGGFLKISFGTFSKLYSFFAHFSTS